MFNKLLTTSLFAGITALTTVYAGNDDLTKVTAWQGKLKANTTEEQCFETTGYSQLSSKKMFKIDPAKAYLLSGRFKSVGKKPSKLYLGFIALDKNRHTITSQSVNVITGTDTVLTAACKPEDKVIKIKNGEKWQSSPYALIAFKTDATGEYSDLPNRNLSPFDIKKIEQQGNEWTVTLNKACGKAYPAGTHVREQLVAGTYQYSAASGVIVPTEWKKYTGTIKDIATIKVPVKKFWPGTAYVKILILANYGAKSGEVLLWDDIKLEEQ